MACQGQQPWFVQTTLPACNPALATSMRPCPFGRFGNALCMHLLHACSPCNRALAWQHTRMLSLSMRQHACNPNTLPASYHPCMLYLHAPAAEVRLPSSTGHHKHPCMQPSQAAPWSKTGGLGDVVGSLPIALAQRGHRVMVVVPRYADYEDTKDTGVSHMRLRACDPVSAHWWGCSTIRECHGWWCLCFVPLR